MVKIGAQGDDNQGAARGFRRHRRDKPLDEGAPLLLVAAEGEQLFKLVRDEQNAPVALSFLDTARGVINAHFAGLQRGSQPVGLHKLRRLALPALQPADQRARQLLKRLVCRRKRRDQPAAAAGRRLHAAFQRAPLQQRRNEAGPHQRGLAAARRADDREEGRRLPRRRTQAGGKLLHELGGQRFAAKELAGVPDIVIVQPFVGRFAGHGFGRVAEGRSQLQQRVVAGVFRVQVGGDLFEEKGQRGRAVGRELVVQQGDGAIDAVAATLPVGQPAAPGLQRGAGKERAAKALSSNGRTAGAPPAGWRWK